MPQSQGRLFWAASIRMIALKWSELSIKTKQKQEYITKVFAGSFVSIMVRSGG
jgi:hypothetical protein